MVILICDDDPTLRRILRVLIEREGHHVVEAGNALQAIHIITTQCPRLALIDWGLRSTLTGVDVARHVNQESTSVLIMTGLDPEELAKEWSYRFIRKPIDWSALKLDIERVAKMDDTQP